MKKIADFLVKTRYILLAVFLLFAAASFFLMDKVNINYEMSKYLPDSSRMKEGTDILAEEFPDMTEPSGVRVMFDNLSDTQKLNVKTQLEAIKYVDSVTYEPDSIYYNKDNHTLYILESKYDYSTDEFKSILTTLDEDFIDSYDAVYSSNEAGSGALPTYIVAGAVAILMVILILMSNSWIEPFLFLFSIGLAILINMGTNVFLPSVSNTTHSITSILQLVLAMDYSIILSNRYRQERKRLAANFSSTAVTAQTDTQTTAAHPADAGKTIAGMQDVDPREAMRNAIRSAIPSVCSSSLTTIVGLLSLCFMNFKIGADLGVVLAKGVFISLLCVFTVLPGLIILFDKLIKKTAKKSLTVPTGGLARFEFSARIVIAILFIFVFAGVFIAKGNAKITYGSPANQDAVNKVFPRDNRFVLLYSNSDEDKMEDMVEIMSAKDGVTAVNTYSNTLGSRMDADTMFAYISSMMGLDGSESGSSPLGDFTLDAQMVRFLYYDHYSSRSDERLTLEEFIGFVNSAILSNPLYASQLDEASLKALKEFGPLCSKAALTSDRTSKELSEMFGVGEDSLKLLMKYLGVNTISIVELLEGLQRTEVTVALNLSGALSQKDKDTIVFYKSIVDSIMSDKTYSSSEMAYMLLLISDRAANPSSTAIPQVDEKTKKYTDLVYELCFSDRNYKSSWKMTLEELFDHVLSSETFDMFLDDDTRKILTAVKFGLVSGKSQLVGKNYSLFVMNTILVDGEDESMDFTKELDELCKSKLDGNYYLIGSSPMAVEMSRTFKSEMNKITLITAAAIFIVVLITFRNFLVPLILVLLIQCSVYITMFMMSVMGADMNYLALLIVQSLLMGATIDYAIVFTNFYIEKRVEKGKKKEALISAYKASIRTILTSGMIMIFITWIMGYVFEDPSTGQICHIISIGVACALVMILFFLPGMLTAFDRLIVPRRAFELPELPAPAAASLLTKTADPAALPKSDDPAGLPAPSDEPQDNSTDQP